MLKQVSVLLLLAAAAQATPVTTISWATPVSFNVPWIPVSDDSTPEWAKLPNAQQWYQFQTGIEAATASGILMILRALQFTGDTSTYFWMDIYSVSTYAQISPDVANPEPATLVMIAGGLLLIWLRRRSAGRTRAACGGAGRRRLSLT